jgi:hypothetical protein
MPEHVTAADAFLPLDRGVWQAWIDTNWLDENAYSAKWRKRLRLLVPYLTTLAVLCYFVH